jgi:predicted ATP-dependent endonuclease of OLD family
MKLLAAQVIGFQSFSDSGKIEFTDGINLIVGQNNAGKSAFLRALQIDLPNDRHRNSDKWEDFKLPNPETQASLLPMKSVSMCLSERSWF